MWARPEFGPISYDQFSYRVHSGETAQKYFSYGRMHEGGLYQQVAGITPGTPLEFSAWIQTWMCFNFADCAYGRVSDQPSDMHIRIGIDPTGGTVPTSTTIIWSPEAPAFDQWTYFSVRATALSNVVTLFTHSRPEWDWARSNNDVYIDDASLVVLAPAAQFASIQPAQPELGQATTVQVTSGILQPQAALVITDPLSFPVVPAGGEITGSSPYTWTWQFTPTISGLYTVAFSSTTLPVPITSTLRAVALAHMEVQPPIPPPSSPVTLEAWAYYSYTDPALAITGPQAVQVTPDYVGAGGGPPFSWTWVFTPAITGTYAYTFTATGLDAPASGLILAGGQGTYLPVIQK